MQDIRFYFIPFEETNVFVLRNKLKKDKTRVLCNFIERKYIKCLIFSAEVSRI